MPKKHEDSVPPVRQQGNQKTKRYRITSIPIQGRRQSKSRAKKVGVRFSP